MEVKQLHKKKEKEEKDELQLGLFPGMISQFRGELAPRIKATIAIVIVDRHTGEKMQRLIPLETNEAESVVPWLGQALNHKRTINDINSFVAGRDGDGDVSNNDY